MWIIFLINTITECKIYKILWLGNIKYLCTSYIIFVDSPSMDTSYNKHKPYAHSSIYFIHQHLVFNTAEIQRTYLYINIYMGWSFNYGADFFVSEWVDLPASWSCLLQNSVLVLVCTYSSTPATDKSTSGSHFL